jgi:hypothetical protein
MKKRNNDINSFDDIAIGDAFQSIHTILPIHNPKIKKNQLPNKKMIIIIFASV